MFRPILFISLLLVLFLGGCTMVTTLRGDVTAETTETQGVNVVGIPNLTVNHFAGTIDVKTGEDGHITANLVRESRLDDPAEAQAQLEEIVMAFTQRGTDVTLDVEGPETLQETINAPTADLELIVPAGTTLTLNLGAGDITIDQLNGDVTVNSGASQTTARLPAEASFRLVIAGGAVGVNSEFEGVPGGGLAADIDMIIGDTPTQTLIFNLGTGEVRLEKAN